MDTRDTDTREKFTRKKTAPGASPGRQGKHRLIVILLVGTCMLSAGFGLLFFGNAGVKEISAETDGSISLPSETFADGKARYYRLKTAGDIPVRFFIIKSSDGTIRAAFDACDVCWREGLGYYQDGNFMVCRNCGRRFVSVRINEIRGGCNPAPLDRKVEDGQVVVQVEDILQGERYFRTFP